MLFRARFFIAVTLFSMLYPRFGIPAQTQDTSAISGRVIKYDLDPQTGNFRDRGPISGVEVILQGQQGTLTTSTDSRGLYRFPGLATGKYTVSCNPPELFLISGPSQRMADLLPNQEVLANFTLRTNGRINGNVFSDGGVPVAGIRIDLLPVEHMDFPYPHATSTTSRGDGKYVFEGLPPGRYLLGIRLDSGGGPDIPYPRTYYNGVTEPNSATVLELKEGQKLDGIDLLLAPLQRRTISGMVQMNGRPAAGAWVSLKATEGLYFSSSNDSHCDPQGRFSFQAFSGLRYSLFAVGTMLDGSVRILKSEVIQIPAFGDSALRLELSPARKPANLLLNPDASQNLSHWNAVGNATVENAAGHDSCFSVRNMGFLVQDIQLPEEAQGQYAVFLGLASSERINSDGAITGLPYLYGYMMPDVVHINAYLQGQQMRGSESEPNKWGPVYGIFIVPPGTTMIRYFLNQAERQGVPQNGSAARFDDLGLYLLPTELEAKLFVQSHFNQRTK